MRILLVADIPNWAFDRDAEAVMKYLQGYDFEKTFAGRFKESYLKDFDLVHFMNWFDGRNYSDKVSAGVSSHNFELLHKELSDELFPKYKGLVATSQKIFEKIKDKNDCVFCAPGGVHEDVFVPGRNPDNDFVVGFVAQRTSGKVDIKGRQIILEPLMKQLSGKGVKFKLLNDEREKAIPYAEMPEFYKDVDCQICTSLTEGAPNPMFEAASCGKALISTDVGSISEFIEDGINGFLIESFEGKDKSGVKKIIDEFENKILTLKNDKGLCEKLGEQSRTKVEQVWTWKKRVENWRPLFKRIL